MLDLFNERFVITQKEDEAGQASTDFGNVTYALPA